MDNQTLDKKILDAHNSFSVIYQAITKIPDLREDIKPQEVIGFFKEYTSRLAREKLGLRNRLTIDEDYIKYSNYVSLSQLLENQEVYPNFYSTVRKKSKVGIDSTTLDHFKKEFEKLGQSIDLICIMTGAFMDCVITSEYLKNLGQDVNLILLYHSKRARYKDDIQIFDSEKKDMRKEFIPLIVEDSIQTAKTIQRVAGYLIKQGYKQVYVFSPQTLKFSSDNFEIIKSELEHKIVEQMEGYAIAQLLRFKPKPAP
jgi:hypoxanthine-guanine phosphoribosyltransferase